jgi:TPR repeat protein
MKHFSLALLTALLCATATAHSFESVRQKSVAEVTELANAGDPAAVHELCYRYIYGKEAPKNYQKSMQWCAYGAALGIDSSQVLLAEMYLFGQGTKENNTEALRWFTRAAVQGHEHAMLMLYHMYQKGLGIPADPERAMSFLQQAVDAGYEPAIKTKNELPE